MPFAMMNADRMAVLCSGGRAGQISVVCGVEHAYVRDVRRVARVSDSLRGNSGNDTGRVASGGRVQGSGGSGAEILHVL